MLHISSLYDVAYLFDIQYQSKFADHEKCNLESLEAIRRYDKVIKNLKIISDRIQSVQ